MDLKSDEERACATMNVKERAGWLASLSAEERAALVKQLAEKEKEKVPWEVNMVRFAVFIGLLTIATLTNGYAVKTVWAWFIVPGFHAEAISLKTSVGLSSLAVFFMIRGANTKSVDDDTQIFRWYASPLANILVVLQWRHVV